MPDAMGSAHERRLTKAVVRVAGEIRRALRARFGASRSPGSRRRRGSASRKLAGLAALATLLSAGCSPDSRPGTPPRDVLLITVDTLRADHLSSWLYPRTTSRSANEPLREAGQVFDLDALAAGGVMFRNAFAHRGQTFPSVATLLTGRDPFNHGSVDNVGGGLAPSVPTLAEVLLDAGFTTGAFTTNRLLGPGIGPDGRTGRPSGIERGFEYFDQDFADSDRDFKAVQDAANWVKEQRAQGDPQLFTWVHLMGPHLPYDPQPLNGTVFAELFADPDYSGPANGSRDFLDTAYAEGRGLSGEDVYQVVALYDAEIARVGRLLELFFLVYDDLGEGDRGGLDRTLTIFAADHGEELYQRNGYWAHSKSVYSSVLHVPLVFHHPPSLTGRRVFDEIVQLDDVLPTVCDWLELDLPGGVTGRSLLPVLDEWRGRPFESRPAFGHWQDRIFTVRDERFRLVWNPDEIEPTDPPAGAYSVPRLALFDLEQDPLELHDVSEQFPGEIERLHAQLTDWIGTRQVPADARGLADPARLAGLEALGYLEKSSVEQPEPAGDPR